MFNRYSCDVWNIRSVEYNGKWSLGLKWELDAPFWFSK